MTMQVPAGTAPQAAAGANGAPTQTNGAVPPVTTTQTAPPAVPPVVTDSNNPDWLPDRLARARDKARTDLLAELGITDVAAGKVAITAAQAARDAAKTDGERAAERQAEITRLTKEAADSAAALKDYAEAELAKLTPEQREAVVDVAGVDPARQLKAVTRLKKTWAKDGGVVTTATPAQGAAGGGTTVAAPAGTPPVVPPAGAVVPPVPPTTLPPGGPPAAGAGAPVSHLRHWQALEKSNPIAASRYLWQHLDAIEAERAQKPAGT